MMEKRGKNYNRYGSGGGLHPPGKGDSGGRFERREETSVNRRLRVDQALSRDRDWEPNAGWLPGTRSGGNSFYRDKKPPIAGNTTANILPNLPSNIESYPVSLLFFHHVLVCS